RPGYRPAGPAAPRIWSAPRWGRHGCGSHSVSASSTRSITRASIPRRFAISGLLSPARAGSGRRSSATRSTRCASWRPACRRSKSCTSTTATRSGCASPPIRAAMCWRSNAGSTARTTLPVSSRIQPFGNILQQQIADWEGWQARCAERSPTMLDLPDPIREQAVISSIVLRAHLDKTYPGAMVASLSVPWGYAGNQRGGYHLVWPRDLVHCAGALLAFGAEPEARDTLRYLIATQTEDGHWYQNQWLGGTPYWTGIQLDEAAMPV